MQSITTEDQRKAIKLLLVKTKQTKGLEMISTIKEFQNSILNIIANPKTVFSQSSSVQNQLLTSEKLEEILGLFQIFLTNQNLLEVYISSIKQIVSYHLNMLKIQRKQYQNVISTASVEQSTLLSSTTMKRKYEDLIGSEEISENTGSHRAKRFLQLSQPTSNNNGGNGGKPLLQNQAITDMATQPLPGVASAASSTMDLFKKLQNISSLTSIHNGSNLRLSSSSKPLQPRDTAQSKPAATENRRLACIICKETANIPCAGKCGHVCCQDCWVEWMKIKSQCPICREPVSKDSIVKIVVKSAHTNMKTTL